VRIVVLTGMSGSGKSTAMHALEDVGFYTIDNLPIKLIDKLVELFSSTLGDVEKLALVVDARAALPRASTGFDTTALETVPKSLERNRTAGHEVDLLFLDAADDVLERRYSETRRRHPLGSDGSVKLGIAAERAVLEPLKNAATRIIDTSRMSMHDLRKEIQYQFSGRGTSPLSITVLSFGYKYGVPSEADLVFDVRFLPNPHFIPELRPFTGENEAVSRFVLDRDETRTFFDRLHSLLEFLLPKYEEEGKAYLTIAIGCTGGQHRSVAIARELSDWIAKAARRVQVRHRDINR
jgi:RNase adapter protein RapZ